MNKSRHFTVRTYHRDTDRWQEHDRSLIVEIPLQIWVNGKYLATLNRTPGRDTSLALGFIYYQGLIDRPEDILAQRLQINEEDFSLSNLTTDTISFDLKKPTPNLHSSSAAAIWSSIKPEQLTSRKAPAAPTPQLIAGLPDEMIKEQKLYTSTAGAHAVALVSPEGRISHCEEDVGRTNALDKIVGYCLANQIDMSAYGALFSGRINLEMAVKIARAGFRLIFSVSAPTATAVEVLQELEVTYIGSLRGKSFTLFNGPI